MATNTPTPSRGTKVRHVRVPDRIWNAATARAESEGAGIAEIVRERLRDYAEGR